MISFCSVVVKQNGTKEVIMENVINKKLQHIRIGEVQQFRNVSIYPLFLEAKAVVDHLVLKEALGQELVVIREIDEGGHVPQLVVVNNSEIPVLILDGEELIGAKQNRVLNTTVLLRKKSSTIIPVSCTEQGRWHYESKTFSSSEYSMPAFMRKKKNRSVQESLRSTGDFRSDQGTVWREIHEQAAKAAVYSRTGAMRDTLEAKRADVDDYANHFPCLDGQNGILVCIGGTVAGMDMVAHGPSYELLHAKLLSSYLIDAILQDNDLSVAHDPANPQLFLDAVNSCEVSRYKSVGHGWDLRFEGRSVFGSALEYRNGIIHMAFFSANGDGRNDADSRMTGFNRRASYRRKDR